MSIFEKRGKWLIALMAGYCLVALLLASLSYYFNPDSYWHLRMGMDWVVHGLSPWQDHYSFTYQGESIRKPPIIFEVAYYLLVSVLGNYGGMVAFKFAAYCLLLLLLVLWLRQVHAPLSGWLLAFPLFTVAIQSRNLLRPELLSYSLAIVALMLYRRSRLQLTAGAMLPIVGFMLFWTNYHSSILGYVIFFGLFVDIAFRLIKERSDWRDWGSWAGWGAALTLVGCINPEFSHPIIDTLKFSGEWKHLIVEYRPPNTYYQHLQTYVLAVIGLATLLLAVKQRSVGYIIVLCVLFHAALTMTRMVAPGIIIGAAILVQLWAEARVKQELPDWSRTTRATLGTLMALVLAYLCFLIGVTSWKFFRGEVRFHAAYPESLMGHMKTRGIKGNVYNDYALGGYLLYHLYPDVRVFIDGRAGILYSLEFTQAHNESQKSPEKFYEISSKYDIEYTVVKSNPRMARSMMQSGFRLDYPDEDYALFRREHGEYATLGFTWIAPQCWNERVIARLLPELEQARNDLPESADVMPLVQVAHGFIQSDDRMGFLERQDLASLTTDDSLRFYMYRALEHGLYEKANEAASRFSTWEFMDSQALTLAFMRMKDHDQAIKAQMLSVLNPPSRVEYQELVLQQHLLTALKDSMVRIDRLISYYQTITDRIAPEDRATEPKDIEVTDFCDSMFMQAMLRNTSDDMSVPGLQ